MSQEEQTGFFVGYLSMPRPLYRWYLVLVPLALALGVAVSLWVSANQQSVGAGTWDLSESITMEGVMALEPYPVLHASDGRSYLVVYAGKRGVDAIARPLAGQWVSVTGFPVTRGQWRMLEIWSDSDLTTAVASTKLPQPDVPVALGSVTLQGEIVDSKCYLGVMKPGAGKVHRACAEMCVLGGLPPMLIATGPDGNKAGYLLTDSEGGPANTQVLPSLAIPVSIRGELFRRGTLRYIRLDKDGVTVRPEAS